MPKDASCRIEKLFRYRFLATLLLREYRREGQRGEVCAREALDHIRAFDREISELILGRELG